MGITSVNPAGNANTVDPDCDENGNPIVQGTIVRAEDDVKTIQAWIGTIDDGMWGDNTTRAFREKIAEIQTQNGLQSTGRLNEETKRAIQDDLILEALERLEDRGITNYQLSVPEDCICNVEGDGNFISPDISSMLPDLPEATEIQVEPPPQPEASIIEPDMRSPMPELGDLDEGIIEPDMRSPMPEPMDMEGFDDVQPLTPLLKEYEGPLTVDEIYADLRISSGLGGNTIGLDESTLRTPALEGLGTLIFDGHRDVPFAQVMDDLHSGTGIAEGMSQEVIDQLIESLGPLETHLVDNVHGTDIETALAQNPERGSFEVEGLQDTFAVEGTEYIGDMSILESLRDMGVALLETLFDRDADASRTMTAELDTTSRPDIMTL